MRGPPIRPGLLGCAILILFVGLGSCGKKAPPSFTQRVLPCTVTALICEGGERDWILKASVQCQGPYTIADIDKIEVSIARFPVSEPPCEGCPVVLRPLGVFSPDPAPGGFAVTVPGPVDPGITFFEVRPLGKDGAKGPVSPRTRCLKRT